MSELPDRGHLPDLLQDNRLMHEEIARLERELTGARADSQRLDALEAHQLSAHCYDGQAEVVDVHDSGRVTPGPTLRAAIDAYLDAEQQSVSKSGGDV